LVLVIEALAYNPQLVVAEHNGVIVPRTQWANTAVSEGDNLEIVTIVGGGS
jgi:sulfur carrier protein